MTHNLRLILSVTLVLTFGVLVSSGGSADLNDEGGSLVFVQLLYRHGERTPIGFYPNDPYKSQSYWPVRPGQLMNAGKTRHYELGKWLRERYDGFLSRKYDPAEIHIQSSDADRTLMSAQCNLLGMYPPVDTDEWNAGVSWQPIPVHTRPIHEDLYLRKDATCPAADAEDIKIWRSGIVRKIQQENKHLLEYLNKHTGSDVDNVIELSEGVYDTLLIESSNNFTLPNWTHSVYPDKLRPLAAFAFSMASMSSKLRRLRGGPLVSLMVHNMKKKIGRAKGHGNDRAESSKFDASFPELRKMEVYSAHDTTLATFLGALGLFPPQLPSYASTVMVELRSKNTSTEGDQYFVKILYKNTTGLHILSLPGCQENCPLDKFDFLTKDIQITEGEWKRECFQRMQQRGAFDVFSAVFFAGFLAVAAIMMATVAVNLWRRNHRRSLYSSLDSERL